MRRLDFSMVDPFQSMISMDYGSMDAIDSSGGSKWQAARARGKRLQGGRWKEEGGPEHAEFVGWSFCTVSAEQPIKRKREGQNEFNNRCAQQMPPHPISDKHFLTARSRRQVMTGRLFNRYIFGLYVNAS